MKPFFNVVFVCLLSIQSAIAGDVIFSHPGKSALVSEEEYGSGCPGGFDNDHKMILEKGKREKIRSATVVTFSPLFFDTEYHVQVTTESGYTFDDVLEDEDEANERVRQLTEENWSMDISGCESNRPDRATSHDARNLRYIAHHKCDVDFDYSAVYEHFAELLFIKGKNANDYEEVRYKETPTICHQYAN